MNKRPLYFDYAATTPVDERVIQVMIECLGFHGNFGNPASSSHAFGQQARQTVEQARQQVAELVGAQAQQIVWTSGATESNNLALKGVAQARGVSGGHIITSQIEHKAILDTASQLQDAGVAVTYLVPDAEGLITPQAVSEAMREDTFLVSLMLVNNELGTVNDIPAIGEVVREPRCVVSCRCGAGRGQSGDRSGAVAGGPDVVFRAQDLWPQRHRRAVRRPARAAAFAGADSRRRSRRRFALRHPGDPSDCRHGRGVCVGGRGI